MFLSSVSDLVVQIPWRLTQAAYPLPSAFAEKVGLYLHPESLSSAFPSSGRIQLLKKQPVLWRGLYLVPQSLFRCDVVMMYLKFIVVKYPKYIY